MRPTDTDINLKYSHKEAFLDRGVAGVFIPCVRKRRASLSIIFGVVDLSVSYVPCVETTEPTNMAENPSKSEGICHRSADKTEIWGNGRLSSIDIRWKNLHI